MTTPGRLALRSTDPMVAPKLRALAGELGLEVFVAGEDIPGPPDVIVFDLDARGAIEDVVLWRARCPEAFIAGHVGLPDRARWLDAERAGCDLVSNRGGIATALRKKLAAAGAGGARPGRRRVPLFSADLVAGRLGLVHREPDSPVGPLAVYHVRGRLYAVEDVCPHAGAILSGGELEGPVLTCPRHGSQFDVSDGARLRGPADVGLRTFPLLEDAGHVYLLLGPAGP